MNSSRKFWRLVTYNIHKGVPPFRSMNVIDRIRLGLRSSEADFLLLQEVVGHRQQRKQVENQLENLADERWPFHAYGKNAVFPKRNHGNAILSAVPIRNMHNRDLTIHALEQRGLLHCELSEPLAGLHLCTVHLDLFELTRSTQVKKMVSYLKEHVPRKAPLILGGDFNDWAERVGAHLQCELGLEELSAPSFPSWYPFLRLDRIYVRGVNVRKFAPLTGTPFNRLSDHLPLFMEFQV